MRNLTLMASGCLWALWCPSGADGGEGPTLSKEARAAVQRALELSNVTFHALGEKVPPADRMEKVHEAARQFGETLDRLAGLVDESLVKQLGAAEGRDIEAKLVLLAWDRKKRPQVYKDIDNAYFRGGDPLKQVPTPRAVEAAHAAEPYRLAWEYVLLRPDAQPFPHCPQARAIEALAAIRNNASAVTLARRYGVTCQEGVTSQMVDTEQTLLLIGLSEFRGEPGLRAMLECAALSRKQQGKEGKAKSYWDAEAFVYDVLTDRLNRGTRQEWLKVIAAYPREGLTPEQRQLLDKAARQK